MLQKSLAPGLYELAFSPRQNAVFAASAGGRGEGSDPAGILRLDPVTLEITARITLPGRAFGMVLDDAGDRIYVTDATDAAITVVDTAKGEAFGQVRLAEKIRDAEGREVFPYYCRELAVDPVAKRLYAPCHSFRDSVLCVVDTETRELVKVLPGFGFVATGVALAPDGKRLFVSNGQGQVITVDTGSLTITATFETKGDQLLNLALDAGSDRLFATDQGHAFFTSLWERNLPDYRPSGSGNQVVVIEAATGRALQQIPTGEGPVGILLDMARRRLWVSDRAGKTVSVFDSESYALISRLPVEGHPNSFALDPVSGTVWVSAKQGETGTADAPDWVLRIDLPV